MEQSTASFIERMQTPVNKLGIKELRKREETWRSLWSWIPDNVKYLVYRIGSEVRLVRRDYKGSIGILGEIKFEAEQYEITIYEKRFNEMDGKFWLENKTVLIPSGATMMLEFIHDRQLAEEADMPDVMGFEDEKDAISEPA